MKTRTLHNLHALRVIAALGVVYFHTTSTAGLNLEWDVGSRGVDVFFVISGFIIAYIGTSKPEQFFVRRLIRVVPFYWAATLCVFAAATVAPHLFRTTTADVGHLAYSMAFVPHKNPASDEMMPTLLLGWSLNFEMFFYVLFAAGLRIAKHWAPVVCVAAIVAFCGAIHLFAPDAHDITSFYARPIVLEFCYGIGVFYLFAWCSDRADAMARIPGLKLMLALVLVGSLVTLVVCEHEYPTVPRYLVAGIPSFFIVLSALLLERLFGVATGNKTIFALGEASYIIYLVHPYIIFSVLRVLVKDHALNTPAMVALILALVALTSVLSLAIHAWFEKPAMAFLRKRLT